MIKCNQINKKTKINDRVFVLLLQINYKVREQIKANPRSN